MVGRLPAHAARPVLFGALTDLRWQSELLRMTWGRVNLDRRAYTVDPRWAKRGKEREVPLCDAALEILQLIRPTNPRDADPVWHGPDGEPLRDVRCVYATRVKAVCPVPRPGWRYPDLHSLRRTCATALGQVSSLAVTAKVLGHSPGGVTGLYVQPSFDDCLAALNRAARLIHGDPEPANVLP